MSFASHFASSIVEPQLNREFSDDYDHLDDGLEYILENVLSDEVKKNVDMCNESKELNDLFNSVLLIKCECNKGYENFCLKCSHGAYYIFNEEFQELVLGDFQNFPDLIYECSNICPCEMKKCQNRLVQFGPRKYLEIVYSEKYCSKGLVTTRDIPKGAFICEYAGEIITTKEAKNIISSNENSNQMNYVLHLRESCISEESNSKALLTIVNPSRKGNIGRYMNHSCEPNCHVISVRIDNPIPKIAFFSNRNIEPGEEICFNYNEKVRSSEVRDMSSNKRKPCLCASKNCIKYLPNSCFQFTS